MKLIFLTLLLLAGCALTEPPKYQKHGVLRYSEWDLKVDSPFRKAYYPEYDFFTQVTMDKEETLSNAKHFADLYAAELTLKKGFKYYSYKIYKMAYKESKWSGGGIKGTNYYPIVLLFIKFQDSSENNGVINVNAELKVEELKKKIIPLQSK